MKKLIVVMAFLILSSGINSSLQFVPSAEAAAVDYFLKIDGISGGSAARKYKNWMDTESFNFGVTTSTSGSTKSTKPVFSDLSFTKFLDSASPALMIDSTTGKHFPSAQLVVTKDDTEILKYILTDVLISSYQISGTQGELTEQVSLNFAKLDVQYGSVKASWDVKSGKRTS